MTIAYIVSSLRHSGGVERIIVDKANALAADAGMRVLIACVQEPAGEPVSSHFALDQRVETVGLGAALQSGSLLSLPLRWWRWRRTVCRALRDFVRRNNVDITISTVYDAASGYDCSGTHHILESHAARRPTEQMSVWPAWRHRFTSRRVRRAAALVALTRADAGSWPEARRLEVIPNFTNIRPVAPYDPDTHRMMAAGRLDPQKGFDILVDAWSKVHAQHPDWHLDIFGSDPTGGAATATLQAQIDAAGLTDTVHLCGRTDNIAAEMARHSAFILSSRYEGFGLVLLEAATCGLPCISFDCPEGPADILDDGRDGILVPTDGGADALADALCRVAADRAERLRLSAAARRAAARYDRPTIIAQWRELFTSLL